MVLYQSEHYVSLQRNASRRVTPAGNSLAISRSTSLSEEALVVSSGRCSSSSSDPPRRAGSYRLHVKLCSLFKSIFNFLNAPTCKFLALPSSSGHLISLSSSSSSVRRVTGTLFGNRRGHVTFAVQCDTRADPVLLIELAMSTANLVKEMASGLVRIALECEKRAVSGRGGGQGGEKRVRLFQEPVWTMYCNGRKCGYAVTRATCSEADIRVLATLSRLSIGAGVIPPVGDDAGRKISLGGGNGSPDPGETLYMRARFERVVGSRDSEAFYMLNPDNSGGPELGIFLLRI